jgi:MoxR-like ATPase
MNDATLLKVVQSLTANLLEADTPECRILVIDEILDSSYDVKAAILLMLSEAIEPVYSQPVNTRSLS